MVAAFPHVMSLSHSVPNRLSSEGHWAEAALLPPPGALAIPLQFPSHLVLGAAEELTSSKKNQMSG